MNATRAASIDALQAAALARLDRFLGHGVTVVEAKTGYDLTLAGEERLLAATAGRARAIRSSLADAAGARAAGRAAGRRSRAVVRLCDTLIPSPPTPKRSTSTATPAPLRSPRRADSRGRAPGRQAAARPRRAVHEHRRRGAGRGAGRASVEHLEQLSEGAPAKLAAAGVVCNLLPGAALTLGCPGPMPAGSSPPAVSSLSGPTAIPARRCRSRSR